MPSTKPEWPSLPDEGVGNGCSYLMTWFVMIVVVISVAIAVDREAPAVKWVLGGIAVAGVVLWTVNTLLDGWREKNVPSTPPPPKKSNPGFLNPPAPIALSRLATTSRLTGPDREPVDLGTPSHPEPMMIPNATLRGPVDRPDVQRLADGMLITRASARYVHSSGLHAHSAINTITHRPRPDGRQPADQENVLITITSPDGDPYVEVHRRRVSPETRDQSPAPYLQPSSWMPEAASILADRLLSDLA